MLRKKIQEENEKSTEQTKKTHLKKKLSSSVEDDQQVQSSNETKSMNNLDIGEWIIENVLTQGVANHLKENLNIIISNTDSSSTPSEWLNMFIKSYLSKDDIQMVEENIQRNETVTQKYKDLYKKTFLEKDYLTHDKTELEESIKEQKKKLLELEKQIEQMMKLSKFIEYNFENVEGSERIRQLLVDTINSNSDNLDDFILPFSIHCRNILLLNKHLQKNFDSDIQLYLHEVKILLKSISNHYNPQRKKLLEELANQISNVFDDVKFISPEDYTFIEPKIHNIPSSGGQKVIEGISFAVLKEETNQTIIYADVIAE